MKRWLNDSCNCSVSYSSASGGVTSVSRRPCIAEAERYISFVLTVVDADVLPFTVMTDCASLRSIGGVHRCVLRSSAIPPLAAPALTPRVSPHLARRVTQWCYR